MNAQAPLSLSFHGRTLVARDAVGDVLWSRELPRTIQSAIYGHFGPGGTAAVAAAITGMHHAETVTVNGGTGSIQPGSFFGAGGARGAANWPFSVLN